MKGTASAIVAGLVFSAAAASGATQTPVVQPPAAETPSVQTQALPDPQPPVRQPAPADSPVDQKESRYQVGVMERVIESAVEHGATLMRDRLQAALPAAMLLSENARVRGFRLDGYGLFFDVEVPPIGGSVDASLLWSLRTLDQNDLGLGSALKALKTYVDSANDPNLQQAFKRIELQVTPDGGLPAAANVSAGARKATGSAASVPAAAEGPAAADPILADPQEAYHKEVNDAVIDAMLEHSGPLAIGPDEWLTIAERGIQETPRLAAADGDSHTVLIRVSGATLKAFRLGQITKGEALKRIEVRVF